MDEIVVLPVGPWTAGALAVVLMVGLNVPPGGPRRTDLRAGPSPLAGRAAAFVALVLAVAAVAAARLGSPSELANPVSPLVVGLAWPALLVLPLVLGPLSRRVRPVPAGGSDDVRPALVTTVLLVGALTIPASSAAPSVVGTAVAAYVLVVLAAVVAWGRARAAATVDAVGLLARWSALGPQLVRWRPPRGAAALLALVLGGAWFERFERTELWRDALPTRAESLIGLALALLLAAAAAALLARSTRSVPGTAAAVLMPLAAAAAVAGVLRRAVISVQLLARDAVVADPWGAAGSQGLALAVVVVGGAAAAAVLARRLGPGADRLAGLGVVVAVTGVSAVVSLSV